MIANDGGVAIVHQLVLAASSPLLKKAILNIDPAGRASDEPMTVLLPDFNTDDLNTLLPWLYGDGSDEQQPDPELIKAMSIGQPQTFTKVRTAFNLNIFLIRQKMEHFLGIKNPVSISDKMNF